MIKIDISDLLCLCDKLSHRVDEQNETIEYYQKEIKRLHQVFDIKDSARVELVKENKKLKSCLTIAENDYKNCYAENIRLAEKNNNLVQNIEHLCDENVRLRHELNEVKNNANNKIY